MTQSINDLKEIASRGGGMNLDANKMMASDLKEIASRASATKAQITIKNAGSLLPGDLKEIASRSQGCVVFDF